MPDNGLEHGERRALARGDGAWQEAFAAVAGVSCVVGPDLQVEMAAPAFAAAVDATHVLGRPYHEVIDVSKAPDVIASSLSDGVGRSAEGFYLPRASPVLLTTHPYTSAGGERRAVVTVSESTAAERRHVLQAARLADIGVLAGGFAHEINSPLAAIALRAESLLAASRDPALGGVPALARFPRSLQSILDDVFRCKAIVGALLDYARTRPQERHPVDLAIVAERSIGILRHTASRAGIALELEREPHATLVLGDEAQLRQALVAVVRNAIEASPPAGRVRVTVTEDGERAVVAVRDEGPGIADEVRERIFVPFFTTKAAGDGMGLGLALCASTVAAHGGEIHVESAPGRGTAVSLSFARRRPGPTAS